MAQRHGVEPPVEVAGSRKSGRRRAAIWWLLGIGAIAVAATYAMNRLDQPDRLLDQVRADIRNGQWSSADRKLAALLHLRGESTATRLLAAQIDEHAGRLDDAVAALKRVPPNDTEATSARLQLASVLLRKNLAAEAERSASQALERLAARRLLIGLYRLEGRNAEARELLEPVFDGASLNMKFALLIDLFSVDFEHRPDESVAGRLRGFLTADPRDAGARVGMARVERAAGKLDLARGWLEQALYLEPSHPAALDAMIRECLAAGEFERVKALLEAWPADRHDTRFHRAAGLYLARAAGDHEAAVREFETVLKAAPADWEVERQLAVSLRALGRDEQADERAAQADRIEQLTRPEALTRLAQEASASSYSADVRAKIAALYEQVDNRRRAREWFAQALAVQPGHAIARDALMRLDAENP